LRKFLQGIHAGSGWNISLFHYRNHGAGLCNTSLGVRCSLIRNGADLGRILTAIQVPPEDYAAFDEFLGQLGYRYVEETKNEVYKRHLRGQVTQNGSAQEHEAPAGMHDIP
jgi:threonine dehydratase